MRGAQLTSTSGVSSSEAKLWMLKMCFCSTASCPKRSAASMHTYA